MYKVTGDFSLMIRWDRYFCRNGGQYKKYENNSKVLTSGYKKPLMITMLIPWITFWIAVSINASVGAVITLAVCACIPVIMARKELTVYDRISLGAITLLSVLALQKNTQTISIVAGYAAFGLMWLVSCFTKEPVCAAYVKYNYNGEDALNNPIFMKTNYILAACWGILYISTAAWSWFLLKSDMLVLMQILNNAATAAMGIFTVWFEKWYPPHVASRAVGYKA